MVAALDSKREKISTKGEIITFEWKQRKKNDTASVAVACQKHKKQRKNTHIYSSSNSSGNNSHKIIANIDILIYLLSILLISVFGI